MCRGNNHVCHGRENYKLDFFFVYSYFFTKLFVCVLFKDFQAGVLRELNGSPTQPHLNVWAIMHAFDILCKALSLTPTQALFLHHYCTRPISQKGYVSLISEIDWNLFQLFVPTRASS